MQQKDLVIGQFPTTSDQVGLSGIAPRCSEDELVRDSREYNEEQADGIREEVVRGEITATLYDEALLDGFL